VRHSEVDNDDTLAFFAQRDGASILSNDKDFFRYRDATYTVYGRFEVKAGTLVLKKKPFLVSSEPRALLASEPITYQTIPTVQRIRMYSFFYRGVGSSLTKVLGNLHSKLLALRQQFYADIGIALDQEIREIYPEWDKKDKKVIWIDQ